MNLRDLALAMLPEHLLLAGIVVVILRDLLPGKPRDGFAPAFAFLLLAALAAAFMALVWYDGSPFAGQFSVAPADLTAKAVVFGLALPVLMLSRDEFADARFPVLMLASLYGIGLMLSSDSFLTLFVGLELMSLPVYVLVVLAYRGPRSAEAALKYLVLGGAASATLLMGAALVYGAAGSLSTAALAAALGSQDTMAIAGAMLVIAAFFLKAAIVPFHAWAPDAYQGASVPATAYMAAIVKGGVLLAAVRLFGQAPLVGSVHEDEPPVLLAVVAEHAARGEGIHVPPVDVEQLLVRRLLGIEEDLHRFLVPGAAGADRLVGGPLHGAPGVAGDDLLHAGKPLEGGLGAPEAAGGEGGHLQALGLGLCLGGHGGEAMVVVVAPGEARQPAAGGKEQDREEKHVAPKHRE